MKSILVTGGAGFIGSNFILDWIACESAVTNLDKLTYAGNLRNLASVVNDPCQVFVSGHASALMLGDNVFRGHDFSKSFQQASERSIGATVLAYPVTDPERYGVIEFDAQGKLSVLKRSQTWLGSLSEMQSLTVRGDFRE